MTRDLLPVSLPVRPLAEIARGPLAIVCKAVDADGRVVLLKTLTPEGAADPSRRARFADEGRLAARVDHPNVVRVLHAGPDALVAEWVDGTDLAAWIAAHGPLPATLAAFVVREVARALGAVHRAGVLHRDVSAANVLLGDDGTVCLTDFGLAADADDAAGEVRGTLGALAPEVVRGDPPGPAADLFGLGVVLAHALTGAPPFDRDGTGPTLDAVLHADPAAALAADPRVPPALAAAAAVLLGKQPDARGTAATAEAALTDALAGQTDSAALAAFLADPSAVPPAPLPTPPAALPATATGSGRSSRTLAFALGAAVLLGIVLVGLWQAGPGEKAPVAPSRQAPVSAAPSRTATAAAEVTPLPVDSLLARRPDAPVPTPDVAPDTAPAVSLPAPSLAPPASSTTASPPADTPPADPDRPAPAPGRLVVVAEPWAAVRVDGRLVGTTPFAPLALPAGPHEVTFENPEFPRHTVAVRVESGDEARAAVSLWSLVARVTLDVRPWAEVTVDGAAWGTVPPQARPLVLAPGAHVLRFTHPTLGTREVRLQAAAGESRTVRVRMDGPDG